MLAGRRHPGRLEARRERRAELCGRRRVGLKIRLPRNELEASPTSRTGARSTSTPTPRRYLPVARPCSRTAGAPRVAPIVSAEAAGGPAGKRFTSPPSWSVAIRSGGLPPAFAAPCNWETTAASAEGVVMLPPKMITPPSSPRRMRASRSRLGVGAVHRAHERLADEAREGRCRASDPEDARAPLASRATMPAATIDAPTLFGPRGASLDCSTRASYRARIWPSSGRRSVYAREYPSDRAGLAGNDTESRTQTWMR